MRLLSTLRLRFALGIINIFLRGTHFFYGKRILLRMCGFTIDDGVKIVGPIHINPSSNLTIHSDTWIGAGFSIAGNGDVTIGSCCDIAPEVLLATGTHEISLRASRRAGKGKNLPIVVMDGCWIGIRVTILGGATVGAGAVVAGGSVVNKNVEANALYAGVPAKKIRELAQN